MKKFADHPKAVGGNPENDSKIVADFADEIFIFKSNPDGNG
jgi:hypothetical protein